MYALGSITEEVYDEFKIIGEWNSLKNIIEKQPVFRRITVESWDRCRSLEVDPSNVKFKYLSEESLEEKLVINKKLIAAAGKYLDYLSLSLAGVPHVVALLDCEGWVIDIRGPVEDIGGREKGLCIGASWKEELIGNNGGGTSLFMKRPVFIYGVEHFADIYKPFSCLGVPIFLDDKIAGTIDVSVLNEAAHPGRLTITMACVKSIEKELKDSSANQQIKPSSTQNIATSELMATAIHDLKNPLASIRGLAQLGKVKTANSKESTYFDRIINQVDSLNNSVIELQNIFKPEEKVKANPTKIIGQIIEEVKPICEISNITIYFTWEISTDIYLFKNLFKRAIENLIKNAIQVLKSGGVINVSICTFDKKLLVSVNDNGPGIPAKIRNTLFEPFVYHRKDGTGLGLFMVAHAIKDVHNGDVWFDTTEGKGTTFYVSVPID